MIPLKQLRAYYKNLMRRYNTPHGKGEKKLAPQPPPSPSVRRQSSTPKTRVCSRSIIPSSLKPRPPLPFLSKPLPTLEKFPPADIKNYSTNGHKLCPSQN